jgi:hypothetical protein
MCVFALGCAWMCLLGSTSARAQAGATERNRPIRVANNNLFLVGGGFASFDHPNLDGEGFPNIAFQRRVLRRESRLVHLWVRGAMNFTSEDRKLFEAYTIWWPAGTFDSTFPDSIVRERTRDITVRVEVLADVWRTARSAVYGGIGVGLHALRFRSDGSESARAPFNLSETVMAPSFVAGARLFAARKPYTVYGEVRFGRAYGKTDALPNAPREIWLTDQTFEFTSVNAVSFEGGLGLHW